MVELTALSSRSRRAIATFLKFYVSQSSTARFLKGGKCYIPFADNLLLFPTVKESSKSVNSCKKFDITLL